MIYTEEFLNSEIYKKIQSAAFCLFKEWVNRASADFPNYNFEIIDESKIVNDFLDSLQSCITDLLKKSKKKRNMQSFDYGFFLGFLQGNLNVKWYNQYIAIHSQENKAVQMNKAILAYLQIKKDKARNINNLYKNMLLANSNLKEVDTKFSIKSIAKYIDEDIHPDEDLEVFYYLQNEINTNLILMLKKIKKDYLLTFTIERYISEELAEEWIKYIPAKEND